MHSVTDTCMLSSLVYAWYKINIVGFHAFDFFSVYESPFYSFC